MNDRTYIKFMNHFLCSIGSISFFLFQETLRETMVGHLKKSQQRHREMCEKATSSNNFPQ